MSNYRSALLDTMANGEMPTPAEARELQIGSEAWYARRYVGLVDATNTDFSQEAAQRMGQGNAAALHELAGVTIMRYRSDELDTYHYLSAQALAGQPALLQVVANRLTRKSLTASPSDIAVALTFLEPAFELYRLPGDITTANAMALALGTYLERQYKIPAPGNPKYRPSLRVVGMYHLIKAIDGNDAAGAHTRQRMRNLFRRIVSSAGIEQISLSRTVAHYCWLNSLGEGLETNTEKEERRQRIVIEEKDYAAVLERGVFDNVAYRRSDLREDDKLILWNALVTQVLSGSGAAWQRLQEAKKHLRLNQEYVGQLLHTVRINRCSAIALQAVLDARTEQFSIIPSVSRIEIDRVVADFARPYLGRVVHINSPESWWAAEDALHERLQSNPLAQRASKARKKAVKMLFPGG